ncbi:MAG: ABC transporter ATP-binding protein [Candidatus Cloacimonetes bacterium]|nr:ABC transporter ATP-binding protein [Candidatus Cloacimonadota bacterium]
MNEILRTVDLCKQFDNSCDVLNDVSFNVDKGEFLSILGPSGCGKTTLLRILIGLLPPTSGKVIKLGQDITALKPSQRGMGIVFQNYALFENMSALDNVSYALRLHSSRETANRMAEEMLELVGLSEEKYKKPAKLSGGQQQRVAIARTLVTNPDVMLFDEPMSALDVDTRLSLRGELKNLQKKFGTTMIYITHDQEEAFALSDRILVMDKGVIQQIDTPVNIIDHPANDYVERFVKKNIQIKIDSLLPFSRKK